MRRSLAPLDPSLHGASEEFMRYVSDQGLAPLRQDDFRLAMRDAGLPIADD